MNAIFKNLFHKHLWKTIKTDEVQKYYNGRPDGTEYIFIQECPACGSMRIYKFIS